MHISLAGFLHSHRHLLLFQLWLELHFIQLNLHLHLYDTWLVNILDIFVPVIILNTFRFKYSVLFGTHILLDRSLRVLQIPVHLTTQQPLNYHLSWWRRLEDVFRLRLQKISSRRLDQDQYIRLGHTSSRFPQEAFKTSSRRLAKTSSRHFQGVS